MEDQPSLPPNIDGFVSMIKELEKKPRLSNVDKKKLCLCKLKIAIWACRSEGLGLSRYALTQILGPDASDVFAKTEQVMSEIPWDNKEDLMINKQVQAKLTTSGRGKKSNGGSIELFK